MTIATTYISELVGAAVGLGMVLITAIILLWMQGTVVFTPAYGIVTGVLLLVLLITSYVHRQHFQHETLLTPGERFEHSVIIVPALALGVLAGAMVSTGTNATGIMLFSALVLILVLSRLDHVGERQIDLTLLFLTVFSVAFFTLPTLSDEFFRGYDANFHMFFASGYQDAWFAMWDTRWYGGFSRAAYPPLAHQLVAGLTFFTNDLKLSYRAVATVFFCLGPTAAYRFSRTFVDEKSSLIAAILFTFLPSMHSMVFVFGALAGFVGLILLLLAVGAVGDFLKRGTKTSALTATALTASSLASHHNTGLFLLPIVYIVAAITQSKLGKHDIKRFAVRTAILGGMCALASLVVIFPFWVWLWGFEMQIPIPHPSRENLLESSRVAKIFLFDLYGPFLLLVPGIFMRNVRRRRNPLLLATFAVYLVLGLGGTTRLPSWLFGSKWEWLTFERFGMWATILALPLAGELIASERSRPLFYAAALSAILLIFSASGWAVDSNKQRLTPPPMELGPVFESFKAYPICAERYLALGFFNQFPEFAIYTEAETLDGEWHTARTDPLLRQSGVGSLNDALYWRNGGKVLEAFLSRKDPLPAHCIFVNKQSPLAEGFRSIITKHGWRRKTTIGDQVSLWMTDPIVDQRQSHEDATSDHGGVDGYIWGILPLASLGLAVSGTTISWLRKRTMT